MFGGPAITDISPHTAGPHRQFPLMAIGSLKAGVPHSRFANHPAIPLRGIGALVPGRMCCRSPRCSGPSPLPLPPWGRDAGLVTDSPSDQGVIS